MIDNDESLRAAEREALVRRIEADAASISSEVASAVAAPGVLDALGEIPRDVFVAREFAADAYRNTPLPIGYEQTISQPLIVALMTGLLSPTKAHRVLEIGTGSGYQAAVLSRLVAEVYSVEIVPQLAERAAAVLSRLGITNVHIRTGDGHAGWPEAAPFDAIIITAAADSIPQQLLAQLAADGRMVLPLGKRQQMLVVVRHTQDGGHSIREIIPVRFVPFVMR